MDNSKQYGALKNGQPADPSKKQKSDDDAVERGKEAIEARKVANNISPEQHEQNEQDEKKDAEQWRNEG